MVANNAIHRTVVDVASALGYDPRLYSEFKWAHKQAKDAVNMGIEPEELVGCAKWMMEIDDGFLSNQTVSIASVAKRLPAYKKALATGRITSGSQPREGVSGPEVAPPRAIETFYSGYRFRSRLEARWAVFFDSLGVIYEYEKEGFQLEDGSRYLPDFWLPNNRCWVEVKGEKPSALAVVKAHELAKLTGYPVYIVFGEIGIPSTLSASAYQFLGRAGGSPFADALLAICSNAGVDLIPGDKAVEFKESPASPQPELRTLVDYFGSYVLYALTTGQAPELENTPRYRYWFTECDFCGHTDFSWCGDMRFLSCGCLLRKYGTTYRYFGVPTFTTRRLLMAYEAARQARFEFRR